MNIPENKLGEALKRAYLAGLEQSGEGWNAEHRPDLPQTKEFYDQMCDFLAGIICELEE